MGKHKKMAAKVILEYHDPAKNLKKLKVAPSIPLSSLLDPHSLVHVFYTYLFDRSALGSRAIMRIRAGAACMPLDSSGLLKFAALQPLQACSRANKSLW